MNRQPPGMRPPRSPAAGTAVKIAGKRPTSSLVPEAPTFPAPKVPSANPFRSGGNQTEFQEIPTEKEFPARPKRSAQANISG